MSTEPDTLDMTVEGYVSEKECGHFSFGVEIDVCLTERKKRIVRAVYCSNCLRPTWDSCWAET
jgi:hypothetical protein